MALANENSPAFVMGGFQMTSVLMKDEAKIVKAFHTIYQDNLLINKICLCNGLLIEMYPHLRILV